MVFISIQFLILFSATIILLLVTHHKQQHNRILLVSSYIFFAYLDVRFLLLLFAQTYASYLAGKNIGRKNKNQSDRKKILVIFITFMLIILGFFKYYHFFTESFLNLFQIKSNLQLWNLAMPLGISFYTFQAISYVADIYKEDLEPADFLSTALLIGFFPKISTGPIVKNQEFLRQINEQRQITKANAEAGFQIILFGIFKKCVIADRLSVCVDAVFQAPAAYSALSITFAVISYSIQIYCDFSGYSDMAIGIAKILGFDIPPNFNIPYISKNVSEFWKRWHISLSTWLMQYLYFPLGGNRKGRGRTYFNLVLTMTLGGLWHGANWTYIVWGLLNGFALVLHKNYLAIKKQHHITIENKVIQSVCSIISGLLTYIFICICWIFFRSDSVEQAVMILGRIVFWKSGIDYIYIYTVVFALIVIIAMLYAKFRNDGNGSYKLFNLNKFSSKVVIGIFIWILLSLFYPGNTAFIYSQY
ncbi:MAG: MBOAT family O-acyltransferase [Clostridiales bacterium]|nr:MBOAT family O-acyltransferase [Clostridiales bacterium]